MDAWLKAQCDAAFQEANRCLEVWQNAPKRNKKKLWFAFQMAEDRQRGMMAQATK